MALMSFSEVELFLRCPKCKYSLLNNGKFYSCSNQLCDYYQSSHFNKSSQWPVLIDFVSSIFDYESLVTSNYSSKITRNSNPGFVKSVIRRFIFGTNPVSKQNALKMINSMNHSSNEPVLLIIGGGTAGNGTSQFYTSKKIKVISTDVYGTDMIQFISDAHQLPIKSESVDAVWIQAVLEHVIDPHIVVSEIFRVLKASGFVYAETPFLQAVHEGPFDFCRFTDSGHRWIFRNFSLIDSGVTQGPGTVLLWSIGAAAAAIFRSKNISKLFQIMFFWVRFVDLISKKSYAIDSASGFYFFGQKKSEHITPSQIVSYYQGAQ